MKLLIVTCSLMLAGCGAGYVSGTQVKYADDACAHFGGVETHEAWYISRHRFIAYCKSGITVEGRIPNNVLTRPAPIVQ